MKVAIITGSSSGIGFAIAKKMLQNGYACVINGRSVEKLEKAQKELKTLSDEMLAVRADVSKEEQVKELVDKTKEKFGRIDVLVNNAATVGVGYSVEEMPVEVWDEVIRVNLRSVFIICKAVIPHLKEAGGGRIINIGGLSAKNPLPFAAADASAKAGVLALTRTLAAELGRFNITVNTIIPGFQPDTELGRAFNERLSKAFNVTPEESVFATKARTLMKRFETLDEIAETVLFLCSDAGLAITGQNLNVNCGLATY
ncbi:MAG: SDR family oxidoreductase [Pyrinomonadaceae bacterium]|nr:SDR family oxidoreductase [Pyrinomonadaceae bacterium]MCX7639950.1 SDR family oxidoreductase [Pyrinomonadaceae bacterium]MDW8304122.1 SDR family oxidoreductase [Acidobacteriota bacterium]